MKTIPNLGDQFTQEKIHTEGLQEKGLSDIEMMKKKKLEENTNKESNEKSEGSKKDSELKL